jgi:DNA invertase Pin-like site-specific DNA recombinase
MLAVIGAVGQAEREAMLEREREGIGKAKAQGRYEGRVPTVWRQAAEIIRLKEAGVRPSEIASKLGIGRADVYRVLDSRQNDVRRPLNRTTATQTYQDQGISGAKGRDQRPAFDQMLKGAVRRRFEILMVWSINRLGRSVLHVANALAELYAAGVGLYSDQQAIDSTSPMGRP